MTDSSAELHKQIIDDWKQWVEFFLQAFLIICDKIKTLFKLLSLDTVGVHFRINYGLVELVH